MKSVVCAAIVGFASVVIVVAYFALAASLVQVVDPMAVLSLAMWFGPVGAVCGVILAEVNP